MRIPKHLYPGEPRRVQYYFAASVSLITFIVYLSSLDSDFVEWDDPVYVLDNVHIRSLDHAFFKWAFLDFHASNWHPLTWASHALDYAIWGLDPLGHHLTNVILHSINVFAVVVLAARVLRGYQKRMPAHRASPVLDERRTLIASGVTGLLFGLHPIHVESVAWVAERKDLLCALFFLLSMTAYVKFRLRADAATAQNDPASRRIKGQYLLSLGLFTLALLSKSMAVTLPVCLLLLDWHVFRRITSRRTFRDAFVEKLPFFALSLASSVLTIAAQGGGGSIAPIEYAPLSTRVLVAAKALMAYLGKMTVPLHLSPFYPYPQDVSLSSFEYLSPIVLVAGITMTSMAVAKRQGVFVSVWFYYVVTLLPVLGIIQVGNQFMADRYSYLPSLGPFLLMGLMAAWISKNVDALERWKLPVRIVCIAVAFSVLISLAYATVRQVGVWKNSIELWGHVIKNEPVRAPLAYYNRGVVYAKTGQFDRAIDDFTKTIILDPSDYLAYYNLGVLYGSAGSYDKAIDYFNITIGINERYDAAYVQRGIYYARTGKRERALADYQMACDLGNTHGCSEMKRYKP
jgi:Tfp pilus assembly protein PilF